MKRQRKRNPMTIRYVLLGIVLLIGEIGGLIVGSASIFEMVTLDLIVFVPIIIKRFKYNTDLGNMVIEGFILGAIWLAIWVAAIYISKDNPLLNKIVSWPIGVWGI